MARADLTTQPIVRTGLVPTTVAVTADGAVFDAERTALYVVNGSEAATTVTVTATAAQDGLDVEDLTVSVAAGATALIGPFPRRTFGQVSGTDAGRVYVDYSPTTDIAHAVVTL